MWPKVSIVILNWNGLNDTAECLESLKKITYPNYNIIVVDNGSIGNDAEELKTRFSDYIDLIKNDRNSGFAGGTNVGINYALGKLQPDYILSLNNDTAVEPQFLDRLVEAMERDHSIGISCPKICFYDFPNHIQTMGNILNIKRGQETPIGTGEDDQGQYDNLHDIDFIGPCFLIRTDVIQNVGLFDEDFFCYWEDVDYCFRIRKAGYRIVCTSKAKIWHKKFMKRKLLDKSSEDKSKTTPAHYYWTRNTFKFMRKHATRRQQIEFSLFFFGYHFWLLAAGSLLIHRDRRRFLSLCYGVKDGLVGKNGARTF